VNTGQPAKVEEFNPILAMRRKDTAFWIKEDIDITKND
jgi:hypothetical protein